MNDQERQIVLKMARYSLEYHLDNNEDPPLEKIKELFLPDHSTHSIFFQKSGCFTTLKRFNFLRGCIGFIHPTHSLLENIVKSAVLAGVGDERFRPVTREELASLQFEFSLLSPLKRVENSAEIRPGIHGLFVEWGSRQGLLLPQVALEYKWDRKTFLKQTCKKASLPENAFLNEECQLYCFTAEVFSEQE